MSSSSPIEMEESSDTSREDRSQSRNLQDRQYIKSGSRINPPSGSSRLSTNQPPSPPLSYSGPPTGNYIGGSPYSTSLRGQPLSSSIPAYSMWGSDSSQLYRPTIGTNEQRDKKQVCSTLLITTATLIVLAILAVAAFAAYLGVMTNHSDADKYEIQFDGSMRIVQGDSFRPSLADQTSPLFREKSDYYRRLIDSVYRASTLSDSFRRSSVERFTNGSLTVHFQLFFDRRKIPHQIGETGSTVQDVLVQEVIAVQPVALAKAVLIDIDSIRVKRYISSAPSLGQSQRSRLLQNQIDGNLLDINDHVNPGADEDGLEQKSVWFMLNETESHNMDGNASATVAAAELRNSGSSNAGNTIINTGSIPELTYLSSNDSKYHPPLLIVASSTPSHLGERPSVGQDDSEWKPIVNPVYGSNTTQTTNFFLPKTDSVANPKTIDDLPREDVIETHRMEEEFLVTDIPPNMSKDHLLTGFDDEISVAPDDTLSFTTPSNKQNFLQWFSAQLSNAKTYNRTSSSFTPYVASGPSTTRFFTLKPTAVSYSGVQPVLRPKPNSTDGSQTGEQLSSSNHGGLGVVSAMKPLFSQGLSIPRPFKVETTLNLKKEAPLIESPRSSKAIPIPEDPSMIPRTGGGGIRQQVELLKDFFPPVRRPVSRPQLSSQSFDQGRQQDSSTAQLPIESLFGRNNQSRSNSPIYTFKLNQGQTVQDVLSQLLADLTISDSPANIELDGSSPTLTVQHEQNNNLKHASNKKVDDDRLKPWSQMPFRPPIFNSLFHKTRYNLSENGSNATEASTTSINLGGVIANAELTNKELKNSSLNLPSNALACGADSFKCSNGECVSQLARCNQMRDCRDGTDETNCTCADFLRAQFLSRKICDGVVDCWDYSDENQCEWCNPGQYVCPNSKVCINRSSVCDGIRDCPVGGEDERHCVALAHQLDSSEEMTYSTSGYLMVRREGRWGKLCMQNFETAVEKLRQSFQVNDLGKAVCKELTFNALDKVEQKTDSARSGDDQFYYEIMETASELETQTEAPPNSTLTHAKLELVDDEGQLLTESPRASTLDFTTSKCPRRQVIHIQCRDLECGVRLRSVSTRARIVGGANSAPGAWPWQAALYKEGDFQCGATLINDRWLVSAGHCFYHSLDDHWVARLGALRRGSNLLSPHEQVRVISHIFIHPGYIDTGFVNDISILRMEDPVRFTDYIRPVCLPPPNAEIRDGRLCTVIGWGQLYETGRVFPDTLQQVQLPLVSTEECRKRTLFLPLYRLTNNMFCAGFDRGGRDACLGDSGGPLVCEEADGRWTLQGVTSNGYGCARANRPGVYTKVARYVGWINQVVNGSYRAQRRPLQCLNGHRCALGACLPLTHVCNGITDCHSDGSDERDCITVPAA